MLGSDSAWPTQWPDCFNRLSGCGTGGRNCASVEGRFARSLRIHSYKLSVQAIAGFPGLVFEVLRNLLIGKRRRARRGVGHRIASQSRVKTNPPYCYIIRTRRGLKRWEVQTPRSSIREHAQVGRSAAIRLYDKGGLERRRTSFSALYYAQ